MQPHIIPQEINRSDKIGRFTIPQFIILIIFTCLFAIIVISTNFWISIISFFPLAITAFLLMYFRINKIPLYEFLIIYAIYLGTPKLLIYRTDNLKNVEEMESGIGFIEPENKNKKAEKTKKKKKTTGKTKKNGKTPIKKKTEVNKKTGSPKQMKKKVTKREVVR